MNLSEKINRAISLQLEGNQSLNIISPQMKDYELMIFSKVLKRGPLGSSGVPTTNIRVVG
jgi:hypothetical protein